MTKNDLHQITTAPVPGKGIWGRTARNSRHCVEIFLSGFKPLVGRRVTHRGVEFTKRMLVTGLAAIFFTGNLCAQSGPDGPDVTNMSVEDLMNLQVTSVSKR